MFMPLSASMDKTCSRTRVAGQCMHSMDTMQAKPCRPLFKRSLGLYPYPNAQTPHPPSQEEGQ
jgi:hypothetical protein